MRMIANANNNPNKWTMEATCSGKGWDQKGKQPCYCLFELDARDIKRRTHMDYGGSTDTYYGFICPNCGCFTELDENKIPSYVKSNASTY